MHDAKIWIYIYICEYSGIQWVHPNEANDPRRYNNDGNNESKYEERSTRVVSRQCASCAAILEIWLVLRNRMRLHSFRSCGKSTTMKAIMIAMAIYHLEHTLNDDVTLKWKLSDVWCVMAEIRRRERVCNSTCDVFIKMYLLFYMNWIWFCFRIWHESHVGCVCFMFVVFGVDLT